jgi:2-methylcitrate dehydratase PrpD
MATGQSREAATELAAKFSLPVSAGIMLAYGKAGVEEYSMERIKNRSVQEIADKVNIVVDKERDAVYPRKRSALVNIKTRRQGSLSHEVEIPKGDPENPWSDDELKEKFFANAARLISGEKAESLYRAVIGLENISIRELVGYLW